MRFGRIPENDDWRDHAVDCPNCRQPVLSSSAHYHGATMTDPAWYSCDRAEDRCDHCDAAVDDDGYSIDERCCFYCKAD